MVGDGDRSDGEVGGAVGSAGDAGPDELEAFGAHLIGEGVPEAGGGFAFEESGPGRGADGVSVGLGDVLSRESARFA